MIYPRPEIVQHAILDDLSVVDQQVLADTAKPLSRGLKPGVCSEVRHEPSDCTSGDSQPCRHAGLASLFHGDFDVPAKQDQESHQALDRETG
jgi:hypothetical protein